jgi:hypothetical protein
MIVSMNKNPDKYNDLFIEAHKFLEDKNLIADGKETFHSLAEYYGHMADFFDNLQYKYVMLPLDEDPFTIDLNTRTINVPASFSKCASVQSDQLAETIIFVADRFFDYMDLANTNIYVQWTIPADAKVGREAIEGATRVEMIDLESYPGQIRFAWPLNKAITDHAGTVKFSVRFFRVAEGTNDMIYSLNTLESSLVIKPALQPDLNKGSAVESPINEGAFRNAIVNSIHTGSGVTPPAEPSYSTPGSNIVVMKKVNNEWVSTGITEKNKIRVANLDSKDTLSLGVQAITTDLGELTYDWYYLSNNDTKPKRLVTVSLANENSATFQPNKVQYYLYKGTAMEMPYAEDLTPVTSPVAADFNAGKYYTIQSLAHEEAVPCNPQPGSKDKDGNMIGRIGQERYYTKKSGDTTGYELFSGNDFKENVTYYEKFSIYTIPADSTGEIKVTGVYYVDTWNSIPRTGGKAPIKTIRATRSDDCLLPGPMDVQFVNTADNKGDLDAGAIMVDGAKTLSVTVKEDEYGAIPTYKWWKSVTEGDTKTYTEVQDADDDTLIVGEAGWYKCEVKCKVNREEKSATSTVCKVTAPPVPPELKTMVNDPVIDLNREDAKFCVELKNNITSALLTEGFTGHWQIKPADATAFTDIPSNYQGVTIKTTKFANDTIEITNKIKVSSAVLRCLVSNTLNGQKAIFDHSGQGGVDATLGTFVEPSYSVVEGVSVRNASDYVYDNANDDFFFVIQKI